MALSGQVSNSGSLHASFYQKCSENLQIGVEMETNFKMQACVDISRASSIYLDKIKFAVPNMSRCSILITST